jgi:hypothetical protein
LASRLAADGKRVVHRDFAFEQRVRREETLYRDVLAAWSLNGRRGYSASAAV